MRNPTGHVHILNGRASSCECRGSKESSKEAHSEESMDVVGIYGGYLQCDKNQEGNNVYRPPSNGRNFRKRAEDNGADTIANDI